MLTATFAALAPATSLAKVSTFGSTLSVPATLNTSENLTYPGSYVAVPPAPDAPNGLYHVFHFGADSALWNVGRLASGDAQVPATGQATKLSVEGCAEAAAGGPPPLTQIHFQDLTPLPGGGAKVSLTSQGFDLPVCGQGGASGSTVTSYEPVNLCVSAGDYVGLNDEGGFVAGFYPDGVPYKIMGAVHGATMDSFLRNNGTGNGATFSPSDLSSNEGFAANHGEELLMRVTLGTGTDATHICAGGTAGLPPVLPPVRVSPQTDGVNQERIVAVAVYCRLQPVCRGVATLTLPSTSGYAGSSAVHTVGRAGFSLAPNKTTHLPIRLASSLLGLIRAQHGVTLMLTAVVAGKTISQNINVKIF